MCVRRFTINYLLYYNNYVFFACLWLTCRLLLVPDNYGYGFRKILYYFIISGWFRVLIVSLILFFFVCSLTNASEEGVDSPPSGLTPIVVGHRTPQMSVTMEHEKRMRREIANSNERRRMQSINAGFQNLRTLIPHHEGEKLSKVRPSHCTIVVSHITIIIIIWYIPIIYNVPINNNNIIYYRYCASVRVSKYYYLLFLIVLLSLYEKRIVSSFVSLSFGYYYYFYTFASLSMRVYNSVPRGVYTYTRNVFHSSSHHWRREYVQCCYTEAHQPPRHTPHMHIAVVVGTRDSWGHGMGAAAVSCLSFGLLHTASPSVRLPANRTFPLTFSHRNTLPLRLLCSYEPKTAVRVRTYTTSRPQLTIVVYRVIPPLLPIARTCFEHTRPTVANLKNVKK